jgi:hypothetical protein
MRKHKPTLEELDVQRSLAVLHKDYKQAQAITKKMMKILERP